MEKTLDLIYKVELLEDLVVSQEQSLIVKSQLISLLEDELKMHKRNNLLISTMMVALAILLTIFLGLSCIL
jgi:hypothetical protein